VAKRSESIAVFGGAFDPPHAGHVLVPALVLSLADVDRVVVVPSYNHAFGKNMVRFEHRMEMCEEAFSIYGTKVMVSSIEKDIAQGSRPSYTLETLKALQAGFRDAEVHLVIGTDILSEADKWFRFDEIERNFRPIVIGRSGYLAPERRDVLPELPDIRSKEIRKTLSNQGAMSPLIPLGVQAVIERHGLYRSSP
jgi:nicotinate-nucleotide adenylyltransferase